MTMVDEHAALKRFEEETEPELESVARVRARIEGTLEAPARGAGWLRPLGFGLAAGALAAVLAVVLLPRGSAPTGELLAETTTEASPLPGLDLTFEGHGLLQGTDDAPVIAWEAGTLGVEVHPAAGLEVTVRTGEAAVRVLGTVFEVTRDPTGTHIAVTRGAVGVTCSRGGEHRLEAGADAFCLPTSAAGMLARARAQQDANAPATSVLESVADGLTRPGATDPVTVELRIVRIEALRDAGKTSEALAEARALLPDAAHREREVRALISALGGS